MTFKQENVVIRLWSDCTDCIGTWLGVGKTKSSRCSHVNTRYKLGVKSFTPDIKMQSARSSSSYQVFPCKKWFSNEWCPFMALLPLTWDTPCLNPPAYLICILIPSAKCKVSWIGCHYLDNTSKYRSRVNTRCKWDLSNSDIHNVGTPLLTHSLGERSGWLVMQQFEKDSSWPVEVECGCVGWLWRCRSSAD